MATHMLRSLFILAGALMLASFGYEMAEAEPASPKVTELLHTHLVGIEGKDAHVITVELAPRQMSGRHYHPGPELIYILEGAGVLQVDEKPPITLSPGVVMVLDPRQVHAVTNTNQTGTLKFLVVQLLDKGQPEIVWMK